MQDWLVQYLQRIGALGPDKVGRRARMRHCPRCRRQILVGLDADRCALVATVDALPLSPLGEALALLAGLDTYALHVGAGRCELQARDRWQIAGSPAGQRLDVYASHRCQRLALPTAASVNQPPPPPASQVPF